ncbi:uncharacterized protein LTR77_008901 [Saxophila tyrrhenica]|uniref:BHLH domain-containing protein n=1 Tax=Saxophila tyrrhenica TaxID=1690608 RepID=A0AAV9NZQ1_9PEZI|nr:hypothetical protein LTR77_008901 [Saxophila tyrrhenica]
MDSADNSSTPPQQHSYAEHPRKKRVRNWTAEDRAKHRVLEKSRRESFNSRLVELAHVIPALQGTKDSQLSKHVIVDESVKWHESQQTTNERLTASIDSLMAERDRLLNELNAFRQCVGLLPHQPGEPAPDPSQHQTQMQHTASQPGLDTVRENFDDHDWINVHGGMAGPAPNNALHLEAAVAEGGQPPRSGLESLDPMPYSTELPDMFDPASLTEVEHPSQTLEHLPTQDEVLESWPPLIPDSHTQSGHDFSIWSIPVI